MRHETYRLSQVERKRIGEHFGCGRTVGRIRQTVYRRTWRVTKHLKLTKTAVNLMQMARMLSVVPNGCAK